MDRICILTDSSCDIDDTTAESLDIHVLRMPMMIDGKEYMDGKDIDVNGIKNYLRNGVPVKTAQATLGSLMRIYETLLDKYDRILHIPLSSGLSGMYDTSLVQSKLYDGRIVVVDAKCACYPVTQLCLDCRKLIEKGYSLETIKEMIESEESMMEAIIIPDDIKYLKMGGRISPAAAALANLLRITPVLYLKKGMIDVFDKTHTVKKAISKGYVPILDVDDYSKYYWMVITDENDELAKEIMDHLHEVTGEEVSFHEFGPVIISHTGPGTIAFGRLKKLV